jgi:hypothetical protein
MATAPTIAAVTSVGTNTFCVGKNNGMTSSTPNKTIAYPQKENLIANAACSRPPSHRRSSNAKVMKYPQSRSVSTKDCGERERATLLQRRKLDPLSPIIFNVEGFESTGALGMVGNTYIGSKHHAATAFAPKQQDESAADNRCANDKVVTKASVALSRQTKMKSFKLQRSRTKRTCNLSDATPLSLKGTADEYTTRTTSPQRQTTRPGESKPSHSITMTPVMQRLVSKYGTNPPAGAEKKDEFDMPMFYGLAILSIDGNMSKIDQHNQGEVTKQSVVDTKEGRRPPPLPIRHVSNTFTVMKEVPSEKNLSVATVTGTGRGRSLYRIQSTLMKEAPPKNAVVTAIGNGRSRSLPRAHYDDHNTATTKLGESATQKASSLSPLPPRSGSRTRAEAFELLKRRGRGVQSSPNAKVVADKSSKRETLSEQKTKFESRTTTSPLTLLGRKDAAIRQNQQLRHQRARMFNNFVAANDSNDITRTRSVDDGLESLPSSELLCVTQSCSFANPSKEGESRVTQLELRRKRAREILAQRKQRQH